MTTELEEQFFKVFGIEKIECCKHFKYFDSKCDKLDSTEKCLDCIGTNKVYPKITDRILLELICLLATTIRQFKIPPKLKQEQLKYHILQNCINEQESIYTRVKSLFKGEE